MWTDKPDILFLTYLDILKKNILFFRFLSSTIKNNPKTTGKKERAW